MAQSIDHISTIQQKNSRRKKSTELSNCAMDEANRREHFSMEMDFWVLIFKLLYCYSIGHPVYTCFLLLCG